MTPHQLRESWLVSVLAPGQVVDAPDACVWGVPFVRYDGTAAPERWCVLTRLGPVWVRRVRPAPQREQAVAVRMVLTIRP